MSEPYFISTDEAGQLAPELRDLLAAQLGGEVVGGEVTSDDITDATAVGRAVLTAPLTADGRRALNIWDGTRAHLDEGTDTAERTWEAKDLAEFVAARAGAASWDDLTGKPSTFPPSAHTHDDRYYTEAEVDAKIAEADATRSTGLRDITTIYPEVDSSGPNGIFLSRVGNLVQVSLYGIRVPTPTASDYHHFSQFLPVGFRPLTGTLLMVPILRGSATLARFRVTAAGQMTVYDYVAGTLLYGAVTFSTDDPWPATLPGVPA